MKKNLILFEMTKKNFERKSEREKLNCKINFYQKLEKLGAIEDHISRRTFTEKDSSLKVTEISFKQLPRKSFLRIATRVVKSGDCCQGGFPSEKGSMVSRVADEWNARDRRRMGERNKRKRNKNRTIDMEIERKREREESVQRGEMITVAETGGFALKFKYHSRGRAFTLRSVQRSGPIWIHYNVFASSPGPVMPSIRIMPPHFNMTWERRRRRKVGKQVVRKRRYPYNTDKEGSVPSTALNNPSATNDGSVT